MKIRYFLLLLTSFFIAWPAGADVDVPQVLLVQNSGWMLPFYDDPNSKFKDIVVELSSKLSQYSKEQIVASFNQSIENNQSPIMHYKGADPAKIREAVQSIQAIKKPGKQTYTDTDFKEAIVGAITQFSPGKSCLLWIVTNNKNSPNNSAETIEKNKEFYNFLQDSVEIRRIVAFPFPLSVQSKTVAEFHANGLMFYALAYGTDAEKVLLKMLATNAPFGKQPARLKPLNSDALTFVPTGVRSKDVNVHFADDQKTLVMKVSANSKPETAELTGRFRNDFYPYDIQSAEVDISTKGFESQGKDKIFIELSTKDIQSIPAGGMSADLGIKIKVPAIPSQWDPEVIFGNGYKTEGVVEFVLNKQKLAMSNDFSKSMASLFPNDPLPDLFVPGKAAEKSVTTQKLLILVEYPSGTLLLLAALTPVAIGLLAWLVMIVKKEKGFSVSVDGHQKSYAMRPFTELLIKNQQGERVGKLKRRLGRPVATIDKGKRCPVRVM